jgi:hypothetical protein
MERSARFLRVEPQTFQRADHPRRNIVQAIEPEAEHLLVQAGGKVLREPEDYVYEEHWDCPWPTLIITFPPNTRLVYLAPTGQEDGTTIFMAALLPGLWAELHLTYDYRLFFLFCPLEEFFTLRVAQVRIFAEGTSGEYLPDKR